MNRISTMALTMVLTSVASCQKPTTTTPRASSDPLVSATPTVVAGPPAAPSARDIEKAMQWLFGPFPPESEVPTGFQRHELAISTNEPDPSIPTQALSKWTMLEPGHQVDVPEWPEQSGNYYIQRLTENTWWILSDMYCTTLYVGETEALIIDMPEFTVMDELFASIAEIIGDKPLTTLVYSHPHMDHIGKAGEFVEYQRARGIDVKIVGSERMIREIRRYQQPIPEPTIIVADGRSQFSFDGKPFVYATIADWAHTGADAYTITPDGVLHVVDIFYGNRLPLHDYSGVQNMNGWIEIMRHLAGEQWIFANIGHVNVASRKGIRRSLEYTKDLYDAWFEIAPKYWDREYFPHGRGYVGAFLRNLFDKVSYEVALDMKAKWGHLPHWTLAHDHAMQVQWDLFLNYRFRDAPQIRPSFEPIGPGGASTKPGPNAKP